MKERLLRCLNKIKTWKEDFISFVVVSAIAFLFLTNSPLHPWVNGEAGTDSSVFKTVAFMMRKGFMLYKQTFDHKGPLIYFINLLGDSISPYRGVWLIEFLFLIISMLAIYKTARLFCGWISAGAIVALSMSLLAQYFDGGNLCEEYAMCFIAVSLYIFIDYFFNSRISVIRLLVAGGTFGATLLLRPNMVAMWAVMSIAVIIRLIFRREYAILLRYLLLFVLGAVAVVAPFIIWLAINGSLADMIQCYIVFNMNYTFNGNGHKFGGAEWCTLIFFFGTTVFMLSFFLCVFDIFRNISLLNVSYLITMFFSLITIGMAGRAYGHYGMVLVPLASYPLGRGFSYLEKVFENKETKILAELVAILLVVMIVMPSCIADSYNVVNYYFTRTDSHRDEAIEQIVSEVNKNTDPDDPISVYGNLDIIYVLSERIHATHYSCQFPLCYVMPEIGEDYFQQLKSEQPKIIVVQEGHFDDDIRTFLTDNPYSLIWSEDGDDGKLVYLHD